MNYISLVMFYIYHMLLSVRLIDNNFGFVVKFSRVYIVDV